MSMLFYKHLTELRRSYSKSLRYLGSSPYKVEIVSSTFTSIFVALFPSRTRGFMRWNKEFRRGLFPIYTFDIQLCILVLSTELTITKLAIFLSFFNVIV